MIMIGIIGYIVGMIITLLLALWQFTDITGALYIDDSVLLFLVSLAFPILLPTLLVLTMAKLLQKFLNFIFLKMRKWGDKNDR